MQPKLQNVQRPVQHARDVRAQRVTPDCLRRVLRARGGAVCMEWCVQQVQVWRPREHVMQDAVQRVRVFRGARAGGVSKWCEAGRVVRAGRLEAADSAAREGGAPAACRRAALWRRT